MPNQLIEKLDQQFDEITKSPMSLLAFEKITIKSYLHSRDSSLIQAILDVVENMRDNGDSDLRSLIGLLTSFKQ